MALAQAVGLGLEAVPTVLSVLDTITGKNKPPASVPYVAPTARSKANISDYQAFNNAPQTQQAIRDIRNQQSQTGEEALAQASRMGILNSSAAANTQNQISEAAGSDIAKARLGAALQTWQDQQAQNEAEQGRDIQREQMALQKYLGENGLLKDQYANQRQSQQDTFGALQGGADVASNLINKIFPAKK